MIFFFSTCSFNCSYTPITLQPLQHQKNALYNISLLLIHFGNIWMEFELFNVHQFINFYQMKKKIPALSTYIHDIRYPMQSYVLFSSIQALLFSSIQGLKVFNLWIRSGFFIYLLFPSIYDHDIYFIGMRLQDAGPSREQVHCV